MGRSSKKSKGRNLELYPFIWQTYEFSYFSGVFNMKRIIRCQAIDVDMNHAKDGFLTDTQITGNRVNGERTLEEWVPDEDENAVSLELDETDTNGWRAEDMFKANEETYGVQVRILITLICYIMKLFW